MRRLENKMKSKDVEEKLEEQQKEIEKLKKRMNSEEWMSLFLLFNDD
jgi:hypothetical protein